MSDENRKRESSERPAKRYMGSRGTFLLGSYLLLLGLLLIAGIVHSWNLQAPEPAAVKSGAEASEAASGPADEARSSPAGTETQTEAKALKQKIFGLVPVDSPSQELRLFLIVLLAGALGSWLHATSSFLAFIGNREFVSSWILWYVGRPIVGSVLALIVYFALRGGLLPNAGNDSAAISEYGFAAFSGLVGMFSERATKKLRDIFEVIFASRQTDKDPLGKGESKSDNPKPAVSGLDPSQVARGSGDTPVKIAGDGFNDESTVEVAGEPITPSSKTENTLEITVPADELTQPGQVKITVTNPEPGGGQDSAELTVT